MFGPYSLQIIIKYYDNVAIAACVYIYITHRQLAIMIDK